MAKKKPIELNEQEIENIITGLQMRMCYIETGTTTLSAQDWQNIPFDKDGKKRVGVGRVVNLKALSQDQMRLLIASNDLIERLRKL